MNRLRGKFLQFASFVAALTALFVLVVSVPFAGAAASGTDTPKNSHDYYKIRDPKVDPKLSSAQRARVQRDAAFTKRQATKKMIQDVMSGKQPASSGGGAK